MCKKTSLFTCFATALMLAGCAVSPEPLDELELASFAEDKEQRVTSDQEPVSRSLTLYEAMARGLKYNLDHQVEVMETLLRDQQLRVAHYSSLPNLVANTGYADRNNFSGGSSSAILTSTGIGGESLTSSTSSERDVRTADLRFSWNILDFGLSYIRARQTADRVLIADETRRRVVNRIVEDVRTSYWRAVTAARLLKRLRRLEGRVRRALSDTQRLAEDGQSSPLTALTYERELVEIQREIRRLHGELSTAKTQLAALINVKPGTHFHVRVPRYMPEPRPRKRSASNMVSTALKNRSELREAAYNQRINLREAEAAIVELLPGISFDAAPNWNSNDFLFNNNWVSWGAQASWNVMRVFQYPARRAELDARDALLDKRALAVTMAVMTQVHVSRARFIHARRRYKTAKHFNRVQSRIVHQIRRALAAGKVSEQTAIREEMNSLVSQVKLDLAYVELQSAFANIYASMGLSPYDDVTRTENSVGELKTLLQAKWRGLGDKLSY